jgi:hypothetical protein
MRRVDQKHTMFVFKITEEYNRRNYTGRHWQEKVTGETD